MSSQDTTWIDFASEIPQRTTALHDNNRIICDLDDQVDMVKKMRPEQSLIIRNCKHSDIVVAPNERIVQVIVENCTKCAVQLLDSSTIRTRSVIIRNSTECEFFFDEVDLRRIECWNVTNSDIMFSDSPTLLENATIICDSQCRDIKVGRVVIRPEPYPKTYRVFFSKVKVFDVVGSEPTELYSTSTFNIEGELTTQKLSVEDATKQLELLTYDPIIEAPKDAMCISLDEEDLEVREYIDFPDALLEKVKKVADIIKHGKHVVFYTGAGISTSASIPDYRGPKGMWTLKARGGRSEVGLEMITQATPTYSHYAITELLRRDLAHFVASTNMDGLHRRSGTPAEKISELHGNSYKEVCYDCGQEYLRAFDVTDTVENYLDHYTGRICSCGGDLKDTINHFTEPMNEEVMASSTENALKSDVSIVMGTTMRVHPAASFPEKALRNNGSLVIVNLQYTPYDNEATVKVHARTDEFMTLLMQELGIEEFDRSFDILQQLPKYDDDEQNYEEDEQEDQSDDN